MKTDWNPWSNRVRRQGNRALAWVGCDQRQEVPIASAWNRKHRMLTCASLKLDVGNFSEIESVLVEVFCGFFDVG